MQPTHTFDSFNVGDKLAFANVMVQISGPFGVQSYTCREAEIIVEPYAQHAKSIVVLFTEKGKRKRSGIRVYGDTAFLLIVPQTDAALPVDGFKAARVDGVMTVRESRYASYDSRYQTDHIAALDFNGITPLLYLNPQETVIMPTMAEVIEDTPQGFTRRVVPIAELATVAEIIGESTNRSLRRELQGQPVLKGFNGPMWGNDSTVRYETEAVSEVLSA